MAFKQAVLERKLAHNPADTVKQPREERVREINPWKGQEVWAFLDHARTDGLYAAFRLAASTGMRRGEVCGLRWGDIDLTTGKLTVNRARVVVDGKAQLSTPKTSDSARSIGLDPETVFALVQHRLARQQAIYPAELQPSDDVFLDWYGKPLHPEHLSYRFEELVKSSGLPWLTMHGLRHSWATIALTNRVPIKVVSGRLGHKDITVTLRTYQRWLPEADADAANVVAAAFQPSTINQPNPLPEAVTGPQSG